MPLSQRKSPAFTIWHIGESSLQRTSSLRKRGSFMWTCPIASIGECAFSLTGLHQARNLLPNDPWRKAQTRTRTPLKPLRYAGEDLDGRRCAIEAEISSDIQLQIRTHRPGQGRIEAHLRGPLHRIVVVVGP